MLLVGLFATFLILLLVLGDWIHFTRLSPSACRYGCGIGREEDRLPITSGRVIGGQFNPSGVLTLPHGIARWCHEEHTILLRPHYAVLSRGFRTAWPIKGSIEIREEPGATRLLCVKRIPWSSAIITFLWFALVGLGTVGFVVAYVLEGGLATAWSILVGLSVTGVGVMAFLFGLVTVVLAYRLENARLVEAYRELRDALSQVEPAATPEGEKAG